MIIAMKERLFQIYLSFTLNAHFSELPENLCWRLNFLESEFLLRRSPPPPPPLRCEAFRMIGTKLDVTRWDSLRTNFNVTFRTCKGILRHKRDIFSILFTQKLFQIVPKSFVLNMFFDCFGNQNKQHRIKPQMSTFPTHFRRLMKFF